MPAASIIALGRDPAHASDLSVTVREADYGKAETLSSALEAPLLPPAQLFDRVKRAGGQGYVQSNPLPICTRPLVLIKGKRT